jgi:hypothetical protein
MELVAQVMLKQTEAAARQPLSHLKQDVTRGCQHRKNGQVSGRKGTTRFANAFVAILRTQLALTFVYCKSSPTVAKLVT